MYFAEAIAQVKAQLPNGGTACVLLEGVLGAGKTTFVQEFLSTLGLPTESVQSPTFLKALEYELPGGDSVIHMDCYRMDSTDEISKLGLEAFRPAKLWLIEWPGLFEKALQENSALISMCGLNPQALRVRIEVVGDQRKIHIERARLA